jgi:hypothetical protein
MATIEETSLPSAGAGLPIRPSRHAGLMVFVGLTVLIGTGVARIAATYRVFCQTFDEPYHIAAGMEWWDHGKYQWERKHPPLSRIAMALGPFLDGLHSMGHPLPMTAFWRKEMISCTAATRISAI